MSDLGIGPLVQSAGNTLATDQSGDSWLASSWWQQLQPGSWRGNGFVLDVAEARAGRRTAVHEYPYRDTVWVEDLGKLPRRIAFQAFLVGDDVYQQRDRMLAACEQAGAGTLVHPTLGTMQAVLVEFAFNDRRDRGRIVEISFQFINAADAQMPAAAVATGQAVEDAAGALSTASAGDVSLALNTGAVVPQEGLAAVPDFAAQAVNAVNDPARALGAVTGLVGYFGRYAGGRLGAVQPGATVATALASAITSRETVLTAANALVAAAARL